MPSTVYANMRSVVHKGSMDVHMVFPDVCKTPSPGGPVPIPYPNMGISTDTVQGPTSVKVEGQMPMVKSAKYMNTSCDEPGTVGGVVSGVNMGECEFMLYSFNVKFEGRNVCRVGDMVFHNKKNIVG
jgi:hypothetical protein